LRDDENLDFGPVFEGEIASPEADEPCPTAEALAPLIERQGVALLDLTPHSCRWPLPAEDGQALRFCGELVSRQPYCQAHGLRAFAAPFGRERKAAERTAAKALLASLADNSMKPGG
jgi:hypothetical protein